jgi:hypothetical protein
VREGFARISGNKSDRMSTSDVPHSATPQVQMFSQLVALGFSIDLRKELELPWGFCMHFLHFLGSNDLNCCSCDQLIVWMHNLAGWEKLHSSKRIYTLNCYTMHLRY